MKCVGVGRKSGLLDGQPRRHLAGTTAKKSDACRLKLKTWPSTPGPGRLAKGRAPLSSYRFDPELAAAATMIPDSTAADVEAIRAHVAGFIVDARASDTSGLEIQDRSVEGPATDCPLMVRVTAHCRGCADQASCISTPGVSSVATWTRSTP